MSDYERVEFEDHTFVFKYDRTDPTQLHIYVRHLTEIEDVLETFFEGETEYNQERDRFETYTATHGLYWYWIDEVNKVVMVITCFSLAG